MPVRLSTAQSASSNAPRSPIDNAVTSAAASGEPIAAVIRAAIAARARSHRCGHVTSASSSTRPART